MKLFPYRTQTDRAQIDNTYANNPTAAAVTTRDDTASASHTSRPVYWSVFLTSLLGLGFMGLMVSHGALAAGGAIPLPLQITSSHTSLSNLSIRDEVSPEGSYIIITRTDLDADDFTLKQVINLPVVGLVTLTIRASHASIEGLTTESLLSATSSNDISFPTTLINSLSLQNSTISLTRGSDLPINTNNRNYNSR